MARIRIPIEYFMPLVRAVNNTTRPEILAIAEAMGATLKFDLVSVVVELTPEQCATAQKWISSHRVIGKIGEYFRPGIVEKPPAAEDDAPKYGRGR